MVEATLLGNGQDGVVSSPEITDQDAMKEVSKHPFHHLPAAPSLDQVVAPALRGKAPQPVGDAVDPPAGLIGMENFGRLELLENLLVGRLENRRDPGPGL